MGPKRMLYSSSLEFSPFCLLIVLILFISLAKRVSKRMHMNWQYLCCLSVWVTYSVVLGLFFLIALLVSSGLGLIGALLLVGELLPALTKEFANLAY